MVITNIVYKDGFGENLKYLIYTLLYSEYVREEFHYTPFNDLLEHNYDNDPDFVKKKERLLNIIHHYPIVKDNIDYKTIGKFDLLYFFENNVDFCSNSMGLKTLKTIFRKANRNRYDISRLNIAIHIRRMNTVDIQNNINFDQIPGTDVPNDLYKTIIGQFRQHYKDSVIHVYSQGDEKDFDFGDDVVLHLNDPLEETFIDLVYADIVVIAPSSFSYSAGLLSEGIVYFIQSSNTPLPSWNAVQNYTSSKNRHLLFIRKSPTHKIKLYYDARSGQFYDDDNKIIDMSDHFSPMKISEKINVREPDFWNAELEKVFQDKKRLLNIEGGDIDGELIEQKMSFLYIKPQDVVLEIGGNIGRNSVMIASILSDSSKHVVFETDTEIIPILKKNRDLNHAKFLIFSCALSNTPLMQTRDITLPLIHPIPPGYRKVNTIRVDDFKRFCDDQDLEFTVLVADCEGALAPILRENDLLGDKIHTVCIENDYYNPDDEKFVHDLLVEKGFKCVYQTALLGFPQWGTRDNFWETWKR
jgi:FkbM family methyltransferase